MLLFVVYEWVDVVNEQDIVAKQKDESSTCSTAFPRHNVFYIIIMQPNQPSSSLLLLCQLMSMGLELSLFNGAAGDTVAVMLLLTDTTTTFTSLTGIKRLKGNFLLFFSFQKRVSTIVSLIFLCVPPHANVVEYFRSGLEFICLSITRVSIFQSIISR